VLILEDHIGEWVREAIEASAAEVKVDELVASIRR
jgi:DNA-binding FrmR family transcriptional regulator